MDTFGERLQMALTASGHTTASFAKACRVSEEAVATWLTMPVALLSALFLTRISDRTGFRVRWLIDGRGSPERASMNEEMLGLMAVAQDMDADAIKLWKFMGVQIAKTTAGR